MALLPEVKNRMEVAARSPADRPTVARRPRASRQSSGNPPPPSSRSRATNDPKFVSRQPPNPRAMDRRRRDLVATFMGALGGPSVVNDLTQVTVRKAAELVVLAEATRAGMLNGVVTDITALIRIEGEARRACRALGLKIEPAPAKTTPAGLQLARARWAADEQARAVQAAEKAGATATDNTDLPDARDE
jgi:hypothetical protein